MEKAVDGVILAAGLSSRMRQPKPLMQVGSDTFASRAVDTLRAAACRLILLVTNAEADWADELARADDVQRLINPQPESEQIDSLRLALRALPQDSAALLVLPVDLPLVTAETAQAVVRAWRTEPALLHLPFHNTVAGHPVLVDRALYQELLTAPLDEGLRSFIMDHAHDLREVKVMDPGILIDIDTPDDYWRYIEAK
jgi:molybdenum cofactor cytidylyltransferase